MTISTVTQSNIFSKIATFRTSSTMPHSQNSISNWPFLAFFRIGKSHKDNQNKNILVSQTRKFLTYDTLTRLKITVGQQCPTKIWKCPVKYRYCRIFCPDDQQSTLELSFMKNLHLYSITYIKHFSLILLSLILKNSMGLKVKQISEVPFFNFLVKHFCNVSYIWTMKSLCFDRI